MLINEVEHLTHLSKKSIRYYEELGLITPKRDDNGYRIYDEENLKELKVIKFLRELNISVNDIKKLKEEKISLKECMEEKIEQIERENDNYLKIKNMCLDISRENKTFSTIDIEKYYKEISILNKEGFTMRNVKTKKKSEIITTLISALLFMLFFVALILILSYFEITEEDKMPIILFIFFIVILLIPILCTIYNLIERIKEILKGEEDEASKY